MLAAAAANANGVAAGVDVTASGEAGILGGVTEQMFLRANDKASQLLIAVAQSKDRRASEEGAAGVDDSVVFAPGEMQNIQ
jgi:hypothetical protein